MSDIAQRYQQDIAPRVPASFTGTTWQEQARATLPGARDMVRAPAERRRPLAAPKPKPLTPEQRSAQATINATLAEYGLSSLGDWAWKQFLANVPVPQIFLDIRKRPEYKARFPAMKTLSGKGRAISEREYIDLERTFTSIMRAGGLPKGFYDQASDFTAWIGNEVSPAEVQRRVDIASAATTTAPPEVRADLERFYGITAGDLTAYFLDPKRALPVLETRYAAANVGGIAQRSGYGDLSRDEAEELVGVGVTQGQAEERFGALAASDQLFTALPGQELAEDAITRDEQLGAAFGTGNAAAARRRIEQRRRKRQATFEGAAGFSAGREGVMGLGRADR